MRNYLTNAPVYDKMVTPSDLTTSSWTNWINEINRTVSGHQILSNLHTVMNPDFDWSRTKGNAATTADGEFVEKWAVKSNSASFTITPTYYTSTTNSSWTGSQRYVNIVISAAGGNDFIIYQQQEKVLSKYQNKQITFSSGIFNNGSAAFSVYFYVGFDVAGSGTDSYTGKSKMIDVKPGFSEINATFTCPQIATDNQVNKVNIGLVFPKVSAAINTNLFYIKPEFSANATPLYVDRAIEKVKIDNA